jgi:hypothetical protein
MYHNVRLMFMQIRLYGKEITQIQLGAAWREQMEPTNSGMLEQITTNHATATRQ